MSRSAAGPSNGRLVDRVLERVAEQRGVDPVELPPLYESIDPDALETLFAPAGTRSRNAGRVTFEYAGCRVTVGTDGTVLVERY